MKYINKYGALILLILATFSLLYAYNIGIYKTFTIKLDDTTSIIGATDASQGGESTIVVKKTANGINFKCNIVDKYQWPYCELKIFLVPQNKYGDYLFSKGLDLSEYNEIFLNAEYQGPKPERLRMYIRNYNPAYTDLAVDDNSLKVNELKFSPNNITSGEYFQLNDFNVSSWWSGERNIPADFQGIEFTNVPLIEIASSAYIRQGGIEVLLREISFRRLYLSKETLLLTIIAMWVSSALIYLLLQLKKYQASLQKAKLSQKNLREIMRSLEIEKSEIDKTSKRDSLTGLRNRAGLSGHFSECNGALIEDEIAFSIVFIDIDFFKKVNDTYGHTVGDDILITFAKVIYNNIRITDKLGRWGGEEFILICKNSGLESAVRTAEKLCLIIENQTFPGNLKITASFGVAEMKTKESTREFIERADQALYKAKSEGRNQVQANR